MEIPIKNITRGTQRARVCQRNKTRKYFDSGEYILVTRNVQTGSELCDLAEIVHAKPVLGPESISLEHSPLKPHSPLSQQINKQK